MTEVVLYAQDARDEYNIYHAELLAELGRLQAIVSEHAEMHGTDPNWDDVAKMRTTYHDIDKTIRHFVRDFRKDLDDDTRPTLTVYGEIDWDRCKDV